MKRDQMDQEKFNFRGPGGNRPHRRRETVLLASALLLLFCVGCLWFQGGSPGGGSSPSGGSLGEPYRLSPAQADLTSDLGYPEAFIILFYEEEAPDGSLLPVRQETWSYYSAGESYTFINGELAGSGELPSGDVGQLVDQPYIPEQFTAQMGLDEVLVSAGLEDFIEVPLEDQYLEDGNLYYGESLAFGLVDGQLRYLEALALLEQ